jgi:STE24 endopeptidase
VSDSLLGLNFIPNELRVGFQLIMIIIYPIFIQPLFNKLTPLPEGELRTRIERLASSLKYPLSKLYVIDGSKRSAHSNAYMYGLPWVSIALTPIYRISISVQSKHIVIFDTLIEQSKSSEVEAVIGKIMSRLPLFLSHASGIAHELGHWYFNHPMKLLILSQFNVFFILTSFSVFQHSPPLLKAFGFSNQVAAKPPTLVAFWIFQVCHYSSPTFGQH